MGCILRPDLRSAGPAADSGGGEHLRQGTAGEFRLVRRRRRGEQPDVILNGYIWSSTHEISRQIACLNFRLLRNSYPVISCRLDPSFVACLIT